MAISLPIVSKFDDKGSNAAEKALKGIAAVGAVAFAAAAAGAIAFGVEAVKAAAEAEAVTRGLENAAKNAGVFGDQAASIAKATQALDAHSTKLAELTGIDDEIINQIKTGWLAVPSLAQLGVDGLNNLAQVVADTAAGTGKDIQSIALAFQRVAGDTESAFSKLTRAGIVFTDSQKATFDQILATSGELAAQQYLIDQLGAKYEGAAAAAANPFERLQVIFENLKEEVGAALLPAIEGVIPIVQEFVTNLTSDPAFSEFLKTLANAFSGLMTALMPLMKPISDLLLALMPPLAKVFEALVPIVVKVIEAFLPLIEAILPPLVKVIETLLPPIMSLLDAALVPLIDIVVALVEAFAPVIEAVLPIFAKLIEAIAPIVVKLIEAFLPLLMTVLEPLIDIVMALVPVIESWLDAMAPLFEEVVPILIDLFVELLKLGMDPLVATLEALVPIIEDVAAAMEWWNKNVVTPAMEAVKLLVQSLKDLFSFDGKTVKAAVQVSTPGGTVTGVPRFNIPGRAQGGGASNTGLSWVGERGPEIITMPRGATITPVPQHLRADALLGANRGAGVQNTYAITVQAGMGANGTQIGEEIVKYISQYERGNGRVFVRA